MIDPVYGWQKIADESCCCHTKGCVMIKGEFQDTISSAKQVIDRFSGVSLVDGVESVLSAFAGDFAFILETQNFILAVVDKIRSYPLFYTRTAAGYLVANSARLLRETLSIKSCDEEAVREFQMTGYVTGRRTLAEGIKQVQPGEFLWIDKATLSAQTRIYKSFYVKEKEERPETEWLDEFDAVNERTFREVIDSLEGRPVWIPLSGGLDSRLVAAMLVSLGHENVKTFSYGLPGNYQARVAELVAEKLGLKWLFIPFTHEWARPRFADSRRKEYFRYADGLNSVPFMAEYFSLLHLQEKGLIDKDAVIINGQSGDFVSGGHIPAGLPSVSGNWQRFLLDAVIDKHYSLWTDLKTEENLHFAEKLLLHHFARFDEPAGPQDVADLFEHWECMERQSKHVVNGQRAFEFFGFGWRIPLWSDRYFDFWKKVPWQYKFDQSLYKKYLKLKDPMGVFSMTIPKEYSSPWYIPLLSVCVSVLARCCGQKYLVMENQLLKYFMYYGPYYAYLSYGSYLRHSKYHRNVISFLLYEVLKESGCEFRENVPRQRQTLIS